MKTRRTLAFVAALLCAASVAKADFAFTVGSGQTGFSFTASTGGTAICAASVTHCFASVPINTAGAAFFTSGAPGLVTLTGTNNIATVTTVTGVTTVSTVTNLAQMNGAALLMGNGGTGTGSQRVTVASDNTAFSVNAVQSGTWTVQPGNTPNTTSWLVRANDGTNTQILDPCQSATKLYQPISQTTSTQLFAGTSAKKTYVCHVFVLANAAESVTLVSGTGTVCATSPHAMIGPGSVTALSALSANGGFSLGNGGFAIAASTTNADNVCLVQVGSVQLTGVISYVSQ